MYVLGINGSHDLVHNKQYTVGQGAYHDAGAVLVHDGKVVAAFEEERLNRIKHTNKWPTQAINACLQTASITVEQVDYFSFNESEKDLNIVLTYFFGRKDIAAPDAYRFVQQALEEQFKTCIPIERILFFDHHYAHAVTAFYPSPFDESLVLTIDGSGGEYSGSVWDAGPEGLKLLKTYNNLQSLGHFYSRITYLLGFGIFDEYKVMGLAPYGNPATFRSLFEELYALLPDGDYSVYDKDIRKFCPPRTRHAAFSREHLDLAASLQEALEKIIFHVLSHFKEVTGHTRLCMAGGVALNCTLNGKLIHSGLFEDVFVFPGCHDGGLPVGSALATYYKESGEPHRVPVGNMYLGSALKENKGIEEELHRWQSLISYELLDNAPLKAAELLAADKVIGWVQGRSEFAPRALGNRSILADARPAKNKERINAIVKKREGFRPFAPSVLEEYAANYFELPPHRSSFPYMIFIFNVREQYRTLLGAVTHVDGTARVQTVSKSDNERYWQLISYFGELTGTPVVLNTSFNNNAEPIVDSVNDAIVSFLTTNLDHLIIGDYLVTKKEVTTESLGRLYLSFAPHILLKRSEVGNWIQDRLVWEEACVLGNNYNEESVSLSPELYKLLQQADGNSTLDSILIAEEHERDALLKEINNLWSKRLIRLMPYSTTKAGKEYNEMQYQSY